MTRTERELKANVFEMLELEFNPDQYGNISHSDWQRIHERVTTITTND